jgi:hypothetical protein
VPKLLLDWLFAKSIEFAWIPIDRDLPYFRRIVKVVFEQKCSG